MAKTELTERQREIQDLIKEGKKAPEIAKDLSISENAVYQHLRKIRAAAGGDGSSSRRKSSAKPKSSAPKASTPPAPAAPAPKALTLLQVARAEVKETEDAIKAEEKVIADAEKAITAAKERKATLETERSRRSDVLAVITGAKRAVAVTVRATPKADAKPPAKRAQRSSGGSRSGHKATPAAKQQAAPQPPQNGAPPAPAPASPEPGAKTAL